MPTDHDPVALIGARVDRVAGRVFATTGVHALTDTERAVLDRLVAARGQTVHRDALADPTAGRAALDQLVRRLRTKIEADPGAPQNLLTAHGDGYRLVPAPADATDRDRSFGRVAVVSEVAGQLGPGAVVTLSGPPGVGKTRVAHEVVALTRWAWAGGVVWVDLTAAGSAGDGTSRADAALADALGIPTGTELPAARVARALAARGRALVVLDNAETVRAVGPWVAGLRSAAPDAALLATSRGRVDLEDERVVDLPVLAVADAVDLFVERAREARGTDPADPQPEVERLVTALDCLPLAIELAATRAAIASAQQIRERVERSLRFLQSVRRDGPARHLTLEAAFDASWELLDADERRALTVTTVFAGPFGADDAAAVLDRPDGGAILDRLVARHVLRCDPDGRYRHFAVLAPWAAGRLDGAVDWERRHVARFAAEARRLGWHTRGIPDDTAPLWVARRSHAELVLGLDRAVRDGDGARAVDLAIALSVVDLHDGPSPIVPALARALDVPGAPADRRWVLGLHLAWLDRQIRGRGHGVDALAALAESAPTQRDRVIALALRTRAVPMVDVDRWADEAAALVVEADTLDDPACASIACLAAGVRAYEAGRAEVATRYISRAVAARRRDGTARNLVVVLVYAYMFHLGDLDYRGAEALEPEIATMLAETGFLRAEASFAFERGRRMAESGDPDEAERWFLESRRLQDRLGDGTESSDPRIYLAALRTNHDRFDEAVALLTDAMTGGRYAVVARMMRGAYRLEAGDVEGALVDLDPTGLPTHRANPLHARFGGARAAAWARLGRLGEARALLDRCYSTGGHDRFTRAFLDVYDLDVAGAEGDETRAGAARERLAAMLDRSGAGPRSSVGAMPGRRVRRW